ncbi:heme-binding protein [Streptomyces collinus]|uniref:GlcG/HbpS family heme-binding protein n=1 Tax=Streptomyces collinus TaxID=42684 RepID=UPI003806B13D
MAWLARPRARWARMSRSRGVRVGRGSRSRDMTRSATGGERAGRPWAAAWTADTLVTLRGDGAGPQSYESAERKAFTAVSWNAPTSELAGRLAQAPTLKDIPGTLFLAGGAPVTAQGAPVAGIGVAGAPSGDLDEKYAQAGGATLGH